jgi:hypothetical protein
LSKQLKYIAIVVFFVVLSATLRAQELGAWELGESAVRGIQGYSAALRATRPITSGSAADYAPVYSISCTRGDAIHWKHQLQLEEALSSRGLINVTQQIDNADETDDSWTVTGNKRSFTRFDETMVRKLKSAKHLSLTWNWGWSWLWLSDEAHFDLTGVRSVIYTLAKKCEIPEP